MNIKKKQNREQVQQTGYLMDGVQVVKISRINTQIPIYLTIFPIVVFFIFRTVTVLNILSPVISKKNVGLILNRCRKVLATYIVNGISKPTNISLIYEDIT